MLATPVIGNIKTAGNPDIFVLHHMVQKSFKAGGTCGVADQSHMQTDRHHFRLLRAFLVKHVERVFDE